MRISGVSGTAQNMLVSSLGGNMQDARSKSLQKQIDSAREQMQKLSENEDLTLEAKMKKRQEIQKQITDLEQQLRQHQMEQRREKQSKGNDMDEISGGSSKSTAQRSGCKGTGMSQTSMQALISADTSMKQARVQGSVATSMKGRAGVLRGEISQDSARGIDVTKKQEELDGLEKRTQELNASQISTLASANKELAETSKADAAGKTEATKASKADAAGKAEETGTTKQVPGEEQNEEAKAALRTNKEEEAAEQPPYLPEGYRPVDISL